jgi:hypothetical protein
MAPSPSPKSGSSTSRTPRPRNPWYWIALAVLVLLVCSCLIAGAFAYVLLSGTFLPASSAPSSRGSTGTPAVNQPGRSPSAVANDFMQALQGRSYRQAYRDLGETLLLAMSSDEFAHQAELADSCAGAIRSFHLAKSLEAQGVAHITYRVTRGKLSGGYSFPLSLESDGQGKWVVTDYGNGGHLVPLGAEACQ